MSNAAQNRAQKHSMAAAPSTPWARYQADLARADFHFDAAQENAVKHLQRLYEALEQPLGRRRRLKNRLRQVFQNQIEPSTKGLYFWGGVGRGKTYLVDTFYNALTFKEKWRVHFHHFMQRVHQELEKRKGQADPLEDIAQQFAKEARIICFDEFFVQDIADAMILGTLFEALFKRGIVLVATSNIEPDDLYRNGLQRARFLPAIDLIKRHCVVVNVDSGVDYRRRTLAQAELYLWPLTEQADAQLRTLFKKLSQKETCQGPVTLSINLRPVSARYECEDQVFFSFEQLCESARNTADYMEIAHKYSTVFLSGVKAMGAEQEDVARRFIALVDELYERKVTLMMSAAVPFEELYQGRQLVFEFQRCLSRLQEMQSEDYVAEPHKG